MSSYEDCCKRRFQSLLDRYWYFWHELKDAEYLGRIVPEEYSDKWEEVNEAKENLQRAKREILSKLRLTPLCDGERIHKMRVVRRLQVSRVGRLERLSIAHEDEGPYNRRTLQG